MLQMCIRDRHIITRYVVRDNGIGMSEEFQKKLFDPFSQEDDANARTQYKGTGLGMACLLYTSRCV